jgi:hypothetical protein
MIELTGHHDGHGLMERCVVRAVDEPQQPSGAYHDYRLLRALTDEEVAAARDGGMSYEVEDGVTLADVGSVQFQRGPRNEDGSTPGTLDGALLSILIHRRECFQAGPYACQENQEALDLLLGVRAMDKHRADERAARGVLGRNAK